MTILIGLGANLPSKRYGPPRETLEAALSALQERDIRVTGRSRWYKSAPVPASDQPWYINGVVAVETGLSPAALLDRLLEIERAFGRVRGVANAPRVLDLDLLAYDEEVSKGGTGPELPHPRLENRAFVLLPLAEIVPDWCHPVSKKPLSGLISALEPDQMAEPC